MVKLSAVIGLNYGDEGKGRCVDWLTANSTGKVLVVRHNAGAQAGHTVEVGDQRHICSHVGSGTLRGAPTLLTHRFVVNPVTFNKEWEELAVLGIKPDVWVDRDCLATTVLDVFLNQYTEESRGPRAHGTTGQGFGETLARHAARPDLDVRVGDRSPALANIVRYALDQLAERGGDPVFVSEGVKRAHEFLEDGRFNLGPWLSNWILFRQRVKMVDHANVGDVLRFADHVIFEGAQGLLLHQDHPNFPHVTRSRTGLEDVAEFLAQVGIPEPKIEPWYVTRAYTTRHGRGPLAAEEDLSFVKGFEIEDFTNVEGRFQGALRFSRIASVASDWPLLVVQDIERAWAEHHGLKIVGPYCMITCCDQVPYAEVARAVAHATNFAQNIVLGWGPNSADTEDLNKRVEKMGVEAPEVKAPEPTTADGGSQIIETPTETAAEAKTESEA